MYEHRFGLHRKPFQSTLTEKDFFESETHREIMPAILHALQSDLGVAVLTGPAGCGKTVTAEYLRRLLQADSQTVFLRGGAVRSTSALLHSLHRSLKNTNDTDNADGAEDVVNNVRRWNILERLQRVCDFWGPIVVLLDDAHLVEPEVFTELRTLLEEEIHGRKLLRLLITGPLSLEEILAQPAMTDFAQRIRTHVFLQPLRSDESVKYLDLQIANSGGALGKIFEMNAVEQIAAAADGSPRCLSLLADECLVVCNEIASRQQPQSRLDDDGTETTQNTSDARVSGDVVTEALQRLQHLPYAWNATAYVDDEEDDHEHVPVAESTGERFSADSSSSSNGVIEIGGSSESISPIAADSSASSGVVEIGFAEPSTHYSAVEIVSNTSDSCDTESVNTVAPPPSATDDHVESDLYEASDLQDGTKKISVGEFFDRTAEYPEFESDVLLDPPAEDSTVADDETEEAAGPIAAQWDAADYNITHDEPVDVAATALGGSDADVAANPQSLEHHLVLAGAMPPSDGADGEVVAAIPAAQSQLIVPLFSHFSRWEPAGTWPATAVVADTANTLQTTVSTAVPVFDRYTWCELGRSVSSDQVQRTRLVEASLTPVWPPDITGVAPPSSISIVELNEAQTKPSAESAQIHPVTAIAVSPVIDIDAPLPNLEAGYLDQSFHYVQQLIAEAASDGDDFQNRDSQWVDGQLMKEFELIAQPTEDGEPIDDVCMNIAKPIVDADTLIELPSHETDVPQADQPVIAVVNEDTDDSEEQILLPISGRVAVTASRSTDRKDQESDLATPAPTQIDRLLTLPYSVDEIERNEHPAGQSDAPTAAGITPVDNGGPMSARLASKSSSSPGNIKLPGRPVTPVPRDRQPMVQSRNENAQVEFRQNGYAPRLLNQARDRVVCIVPPQEMLRPAAGAESVALPVPEALQHAVLQENTGQQDLPRISMMCDSLDTEQQAALSGDAERPAEPRFARLFTRLRQQRTSGS